MMTGETADGLISPGDGQPAMDQDCYQTTSRWLARSGPSPREARLAMALDAALRRPARVLELGAGFGGFAVAAAQLGHSVVAVERSPARADFAKGQAGGAHGFGSGSIVVRQASFFDVDLDGTFDAVVCWNSFGCWPAAFDVPLLRRIRHWLGAGGFGLIDVFDPDWWSGMDRWKTTRDGMREHIRWRSGPDRIEIAYEFPGPAGQGAAEVVRCVSRNDARRLADSADLVCRSGPTDRRRGTYLLTVAPAR